VQFTVKRKRLRFRKLYRPKRLVNIFVDRSTWSPDKVIFAVEEIWLYRAHNEFETSQPLSLLTPTVSPSWIRCCHLDLDLVRPACPSWRLQCLHCHAHAVVTLTSFAMPVPLGAYSASNVMPMVSWPWPGPRSPCLSLSAPTVPPMSCPRYCDLDLTSFTTPLSLSAPTALWSWHLHIPKAIPSSRRIPVPSLVPNGPVVWLTIGTYTRTFIAANIYTKWLIKNVPNFAMMLYYSTTEFKQKKIIFLKGNHSWTTWEIMMLYAFVSTAKYTKEYWVSEEYKITNNYNTSHGMKMCWIAPPLCFLTAFSRFSVVRWIFELSQWWSSIYFWLLLLSPVDLQTEVVGFRTPNPAGYPKCSNLKD